MAVYIAEETLSSRTYVYYEDIIKKQLDITTDPMQATKLLCYNRQNILNLSENDKEYLETYIKNNTKHGVIGSYTYAWQDDVGDVCYHKAPSELLCQLVGDEKEGITFDDEKIIEMMTQYKHLVSIPAIESLYLNEEGLFTQIGLKDVYDNLPFGEKISRHPCAQHSYSDKPPENISISITDIQNFKEIIEAMNSSIRITEEKVANPCEEEKFYLHVYWNENDIASLNLADINFLLNAYPDINVTEKNITNKAGNILFYGEHSEKTEYQMHFAYKEINEYSIIAIDEHLNNNSIKTKANYLNHSNTMERAFYSRRHDHSYRSEILRIANDGTKLTDEYMDELKTGASVYGYVGTPENKDRYLEIKTKGSDLLAIDKNEIGNKSSITIYAPEWETGYIIGNKGANIKKTLAELQKEFPKLKRINIEEWHEPCKYTKKFYHPLIEKRDEFTDKIRKGIHNNEPKYRFYITEKEYFLEFNKHKDKGEINMTTVNLSELAQKIGNEPKEVTLPNGQTRMSVNWDGPTAREAAVEIYPLSEKGEKVVIDGPAPGWFVSALAHTVHPCPVGLNDPKAGIIDIPNLPKGELNKDGGLSFKVTEFKDAVKIEWAIDNGTVPPVYSPEELKDVVLPEIPAGKEVLISGKGPNYVTVAIGEAYAHTNKAVEYFQPQTQAYTVGITHTRDRQIGDVVQPSEVEIEKPTSLREHCNELDKQRVEDIASQKDNIEKDGKDIVSKDNTSVDDGDDR